MDVTVVFRMMIKLFLIMALGFAMNKTGVLDAHSNRKLSSMLLNITAPFLIICAVSSSSGQNRGSVLFILAAGFLMYALLAAFAFLAVKVFRLGKDTSGTVQCMIVFSNNAFMGYPVVQSVLGAEAVFYTSMLHFAYNVFIYTYGVLCISGEKQTGSAKEIVRKLMTPGLILMLSALVIYLFDIHLPDLVMETMDMVGGVTSALSMIVLGSTLAAYPLKEALTDVRCYGVCAVRLVLVPLLTLAVCRLFHVSDYMTAVATLTNAMPVGSMVVMFANQYDGNKELASRGVLVSTTLSVLTIPVIAMLL